MTGLWKLVGRRTVLVGDGIVSIATMILAALLVMWVGGCAELGQFSVDDAEKAASIATVVRDSAAKVCWPVLAATGKAIAAAGDRPGILAGIEEKRAVQMALEDTSCQPIWAGVLAELLKATPAAPFVP